MFYLIWQMGLLLLIAFGVGLMAGWRIWSGDARSAEADAAREEAARLKAENETLVRRLGEAEKRKSDPVAAAPAPDSDEAVVTAPAAPVTPEKPKPAAASKSAAPKSASAKKPAAKKPASKLKPATKPKAAPAAAKTAEAEDLEAIKGLGPKAAASLKAGGVTRFSQIAAWSDADIAEWDDKLGGRGRIARDDWVGQAKTLSKA